MTSASDHQPSACDHQPVDGSERRTVCSRCGRTIALAGERWVEAATPHKPARAWAWPRVRVKQPVR